MRVRFVPIGLALATFGATIPTRAEPTDSAETRPRSPPPEDVKPPRPPLPPAPPRTSVPWERHVDLGVDFAVVERPASVDTLGNASAVRYEPGPGYGVHARIDALRYLRFAAYVVTAYHRVGLPQRALGQSG